MSRPERLAAILLVLGVVPQAQAEAPKRFGPETVARAQAENRMMLLLARREACPRCRGIEASALEEPAVATLIEHRIIVAAFDPDERPDIAHATADAFLLLPEPRPAPDPGAPYVVVATPEGRPIDGTSLIRDGRPLGPAFVPFLRRIADEWESSRSAVETRAGLVLASLREAQAPSRPGPAVSAALVSRARSGLAEAFDRRHGGFGLAPRRIPHGDLRLLLEESQRGRDREALAMVTVTLDRILAGGLRDPRGGFFREAATEDWGAPVREKTLADNALLLRALLAAYEETGAVAYREAATALANWLRTLVDPQGGFVGGVFRETDKGDDQRDGRVFAFANGLALSALARSGRALERPGDVSLAREAAPRVLARLGGALSLHRLARGDEATGPAFLEDYAFLAEGLLDLFEATSDRHFRDEAQGLVDQVLVRFSDPKSGGFFESAEDGFEHVVRRRDPHDTFLPSGNGVMASVLRRVAGHTGETRYLEMARRTVLSFAADLTRAPRGLATLAAAAGELLGAPSGEVPSASLPEAASRVVRGPVTIEAEMVPARVSPGQTTSARVRLRIGPGWVVVAHRPKGPAANETSNLYGLTVAVPGEGLRGRAPRYPTGDAGPPDGPAASARVHAGTVDVEVPVLAPLGLDPGLRRVRLRVVFQACDARRCEAPVSEVMEAPVTISAP